MISIAKRVMALAVLSSLPAMADGDSLRRVSWEGLEALVAGRNVSIAMPGGAIVTGKATAVESDALLMTVAKTTDRVSYPKGPLRVPRATVRRLDMEGHGWKGRAILTPIGFFVGMVAGFGAAFNTDSKSHGAQTAAFFGTWVGVTAAGYLGGYAADRSWTPIEIVP